MAHKESFLICAILLLATVRGSKSVDVGFDQNYFVTWGNDHVSFLDQGRETQLSMDQASGAGFRSKLGYASGFFQLKIKLPNKDSSGVVTAFYLSSEANETGGNHDELDFEFLGSNTRPKLQTNVFANDSGNREQRFNLWFDPTADFHTYGILWNQFQIVFFVDSTPIRVFKNNKASRGVNFPGQQMYIKVSLWNGESWAGGGRKIDWTQAPFQAHFQGFGVNGCQIQNGANREECNSSNYYWNKYTVLNRGQQLAYQNARKKYMYYDYCSKQQPSHPECQMSGL